MQIVYLPTADQDLLEIYVWIGETDARVAARYIDKIRNALWRLRDYPESGSPRDEIASGVRSVKAASHVALYRVTGTAVEIIRIVHGARDMRAVVDDFH